MHVVEGGGAVVSPKEEEAAVGEDAHVVPAGGGWLPVDDAIFVLQVYWRVYLVERIRSVLMRELGTKGTYRG